jgi:hypothetical protein
MEKFSAVRPILLANTETLIKLSEKLLTQAKIDADIRQKEKTRSFEENEKMKYELEVQRRTHHEAQMKIVEATKLRIMEKQHNFDEVSQKLNLERKNILVNVRKCFAVKISGSIMQILHFKIPIDGDLNRLPVEDMNGVLGHISQILVHVGKLFDLPMPFELIPCMPLTFFRLMDTKLLLWLDPDDTSMKAAERFVTALALFNYSMAWVAWCLGTLTFADKIDYNGIYYLDLILNADTDKPLQKPSLQTLFIDDAVKMTFQRWKLFTGDNLNPAISTARLGRIMDANLLSGSRIINTPT